MNKILIALIVFFYLPNIILAQADSTKPKLEFKKENIFVDGNIGLQFSNSIRFNFSPVVGYKITPKLWAGPGVTYHYVTGYNFYSNHIYGLKFMARFFPKPRFFGNAVYEQLYIPSGNNRVKLDRLLIGAGYVQSLGKSAFYIMAMVNVLPAPNYYVRNPIYRTGIMVNF